MSDVYDDDKHYKLNKDRINFVSNILGTGNHLVNNPLEKRILIGRGPVKFINDVMKKGLSIQFKIQTVLCFLRQFVSVHGRSDCGQVHRVQQAVHQ